jgi:diguanylate cyclase (GGDEF)-like protein
MSALDRADPRLRAAASAENFDASRWMEIERLRLVFSNLPVTLFVSVASACILVAVLHRVVAGFTLLAWLVVGSGISVYRYLHYRQFRRLTDAGLDVRLWTRRVMLGTGLSGFFWGSSALVLFPAGDLPHQVVITFVLAGLSAGAMTSYSAIRRCYFLFVLPTVLPIALRMTLQGDEIHMLMALLTMLFLGVVVRSAIETDRMIGGVLQVRAENIELTRALHHQATHDALVDLPNQRGFNARLAEVARSCAERHETYALLFIDLDRFKEINDSGGHAAGDEALCRIGRLLKANLRPQDTAARMGGDEFAVLLPACPLELAESIATKILAAIDQFVLPWEGGRSFKVGASIGLAYSEAGEQDATALLRAADAACYAAKNGGRGRLEIYRAGPSYEPSGRFEISNLR